MTAIGEEVGRLLDALGVDRTIWTDGSMPALTPLTGEQIGLVRVVDAADVDAALSQAVAAFRAWCAVPAPRRGELVRLFGEELRAAKDDLAALVTIEAGKIPSEGAGEVQEMIDICDFAVGLSRQLYGLTIATERPGHRMMEVWHPLGVVGVISAFNFPVAVWAWNAALALVCGNSVLWKPSEKTPLTALAVQAIFARAAARFGDAPAGLSQLLIGGREAGEALVDDPQLREDEDPLEPGDDLELALAPRVEPEPAAEPEPRAEPEHEHEPEAAPVAEAAAEAPAEATEEIEEPQLFVVEERLIRGRPARVLSDGTVEAETDDGWMRFENLEHLEEYLDAMSPGQA